MKKRFFNGDFLQQCGWFLIIVAAVCAALIFGFRALGQGQPKAVQAWRQVSAGVFHDKNGPKHDSLPPVALLNRIRAGKTVSVWCQTAANVLALAASQAGLTAAAEQFLNDAGKGHWFTVIDGCYYDADYGVYWTDQNGDCVSVERVCDGDDGLTMRRIDKGWNDEATIRRLYADYCEVPKTAQGYTCRYFRADSCPTGLKFDCWRINAGVCGCLWRGEIPNSLLQFKTLGRSKTALAKNEDWKNTLRKRQGLDENGDPVVIDVPEENAALSGIDCR